MNKLLIILFVFVISGCQTAGKFKKNMDSWVGADAQALVDQMGYPASTMKAPNGNEVYIYSNSGSYYIPPTTTYNTTGNVYGNSLYSTTNATTSGGYNISFSCIIYFEINESKKVERITWKGNNCVA